MIKSVTYAGLFDSLDNRISFHPDLNLITGKNGCGKTTVLKLIWYLLSGNLRRVIREIPLRHAAIETDRFKLGLTIQRNDKFDAISVLGDYAPTGAAQNNFGGTMMDTDWLDEVSEQINNLSGGSVFFPTFRRIEGGFSLRGRISRTSGTPRARLAEAISEFSDSLSNGDHEFVASISTHDIERLLNRRFTMLSRSMNEMHERSSDAIERVIRQHEHSQPSSAEDALSRIGEVVHAFTDQRESLNAPFRAIQELVSQIYTNKGIRIDTLEFGQDDKKIISSELLSAGEKQMLSFLCYNTFRERTPIFIDEPEISLHVDWQRILFPTLLSQASSNQFIVTTHSPLIYSKYPEKEIQLDAER